MNSPPRALVFDWDNTLVDSWAVIHDALVVTFEAMGHRPWTLEETRQKVRHSLRDAFPALFGERWHEARKLYMDTFQSIHLARLTAVAGAEDLIAALAGEEGMYLAVASNKTGHVLRREAAHLGWTPYFKRLVGAGDAPRDKPDPAPLLMALEGSGIPPEAAWYVGDTALDMEFAIRAGCLPVLVGNLESDAAEFRKAKPALNFSDCAALLARLRGL